MKKIKLNKNVIILSIIILLIGFSVGMEYKKYQLRRDITKGLEEVAESLSNINGKIENIDQKKIDIVEKLKQKIDIEIVNKNFIPSDVMNGRYSDYITMKIKFINKIDKDVRGVQGRIIFYDLFDNEIYQNIISYDDGIPKEGNKIWDASIEYNEFMNEHEKLKSIKLENLKYKWLPEVIIYQDGSKDIE